MSRGQIQFIKNICLSIIFGIAIGTAIWYAQTQVGNQQTIVLAIAILSGLVSVCFGFMFITWWDDYRILSGSLDSKITQMLIDNPYSSLIKKQLKMHWQLSKVFGSIVDECARRKGSAIVIAAKSDEYLKQLELCLKYGMQSFEAIIRGGQNYLYRPKWFFYDKEEPDYEKDIILTDSKDKPKMSSRKRAYLERIVKEKFNIKIRIMIFPQSIMEDDFKDPDIRKQFINMNKTLELYWLKEEDITRIIIQDDFWKEIWNQYLQFDFAIIDSMVLKHVTSENGDLLFVSIADQIEPYKEIFRQLKLFKEGALPAKFTFHKITPKGIDGIKWDDWLKADDS